MIDYASFFLNRPSSVYPIDCLEISHPSFSQTYRVQMANANGVTVTHEDGQQYFYEYFPLKVDKGSTTDDLDQSLNISMGELGEIFPKELDALFAGPNSTVKPMLSYRYYRSDDLTAPLEKAVLELQNFTFDDTGNTTFQAMAPLLNNSKTGELYTLDRFPMLRAFL